MDINEATRIMANEMKHSRPAVAQADPFLGLPDDVLEELRAIIGPCQRAGLPIERDPTVPATVGILVENRLFRVSVVTNPHTGGMSAAILGPTLEPWDKETFLALVPDAPVTEASPPVRLSEMTIRRSQVEVLEAILDELKAIRSLLASR